MAKMTIQCLMENVPHNLPGIVFLSGGQSDQDATAHLNLMNKMEVEMPWQLSYSYGRALQADALRKWAVRDEHSNSSSRNSFLHRSSMNGLARSGEWEESLEV